MLVDGSLDGSRRRWNSIRQREQEKWIRCLGLTVVYKRRNRKDKRSTGTVAALSHASVSSTANVIAEANYAMDRAADALTRVVNKAAAGREGGFQR